jgi:hypothetical protein
VASIGAAAASEPHVAQAARDVLAYGSHGSRGSQGNAVDAVMAGVLLAAAESPSVLLGPLQVLVGGRGVGLRAIDGRLRQPGVGLPRPRGFLAGEAVPAAARVAVPMLPAAVASAIASLGSATQRRVAGPALERARACSEERARLLEAFAARGASVFLDEAVAGELMAAAGRAARGLLTIEDLESVRPEILSCDDRSLEPTGVWTVPWRSLEPMASPMDARSTQVVAAADAQGLMAVACYEAPVDGLAIGPLGLVAPAFAVPVMRGERRTRPGEPCATPAPIALRMLLGITDFAVGLAGALDPEATLDRLISAVATALATPAPLPGSSSGVQVAVARVGEGVRVLASR